MGSETKSRSDRFVIAASVNRVGEINTTYAKLMYIMERLFCFLHDQPTKKETFSHHTYSPKVPSLLEILPVQQGIQKRDRQSTPSCVDSICEIVADVFVHYAPTLLRYLVNLVVPALIALLLHPIWISFVPVFHVTRQCVDDLQRCISISYSCHGSYKYLFESQHSSLQFVLQFLPTCAAVNYVHVPNHILVCVFCHNKIRSPTNRNRSASLIKRSFILCCTSFADCWVSKTHAFSVLILEI